MTALVAVSAAMVLLGGVFLTIGVVRRRMIRSWVPTTGLVVSSDGRRTGLPALYPTFVWRDQQGWEHQQTSSVRASLGPRPGTRVAVRFDPADPRRGMLDTFVQNGGLFISIGWPLGLLAVAGLVGLGVVSLLG